MIKNINFILNKKPFNYIEFNGIDIPMAYINNHISIQEYYKKIINLLSANYKNIDPIFMAWKNIFQEELVYNNFEKTLFKSTLNNGVRNLKFYDFVLIDIMLYITLFNSKRCYIPIPNSFLQNNDPIAIYFIIEMLNFEAHKDIFIITNDLYWANIFTDKIYSKNKLKKIPVLDFYWVESDLDLFTYKIFFPDKKFKRAGSSSNIFKIIEKNPSHKSIIDKDGFSKKNIPYLKEKFDLYFTTMIECENIWLHSDMIEKINLISPKKIDLELFKKEVILRAYKNLDKIILRLKNRQDYLMYNYIPYLNDLEIKKYRDTCINDLKNNDYNSVLKWFDNKKLFCMYIKELGFEDIKEWQEAILENKGLFLENKEEIIV